MLWAAIARRAALGQKRVPSSGMANDAAALCAYLPYCDAMLIDNECRALWESIPRQYRSVFQTKVFPKNTGSEFIAYLARLEA
jgi:hypothetical protein